MTANDDTSAAVIDVDVLRLLAVLGPFVQISDLLPYDTKDSNGNPTTVHAIRFGHQVFVSREAFVWLEKEAKRP